MGFNRWNLVAAMLGGAGLLLAGAPTAQGAAEAAPATGLVAVPPYVFTDEPVVLQVPPAAHRVSWTVRTITCGGWGPTREGEAAVENGRIALASLAEGIHIATLSGDVEGEFRWLAMAPPPRLSKDRLLAALPRTGKKLLAGEKVTLMAMGDSVTWTGDYKTLLTLMLRRASGNPNVACFDRSYPGRSVDASVRHFQDDILPVRPDVGLLMYGLNDQAGGVPLAAYLEQYRWVAEHLAEIGADTVFLTPTPDLGIPLTPEEQRQAKDPNPPGYAFRTIGFAESLRPLAEELHVPLADAFHAVWGTGGDTIQKSVQAMWPVYLPSYGEPMRSRLETDGGGDAVHPNVLGHLAIARAVYEAITGAAPAPPLAMTGRSEWTPGGVVSHLTVRNASPDRRAGRLEVGPLMNGQLEAPSPCPYDLESGQEVRLDVKWPQAAKPEDLLRYPNDAYLAPGRPLIPVVDFSAGSSRVYAAAAPFEVDAAFVRRRQIVQDSTATVGLLVDGRCREVAVEIPQGSEVGRLPLIQSVERDGRTGWAVAELAYVRYGAARRGEATVDGSLEEWADAPQVPVGLPCQARFTQGPQDNRASPDECMTRWALRAGKDGLFIAVRATGCIEKDRFTLFFDSRPPELLGTAGRYYWINGSLKPDGQVELGKGETSKEAPGLRGAWKVLPDDGATVEMFVPYALMETAAWPASGDLGFSIWWVHVGADDKTTNLMWSEDGHPWNPRWYGIVRLTDRQPEDMPFMVRVR
ncbi:MAG: SGNH/GDSL hydrolase family protein [Phycisphaerae bacterium]